MKAFDPLQEILGYSFRRKDLLRDALTHRSYLNERHRVHKGQGGQDNERLEFLGDAVLDLTISEHLIHLSPTLFQTLDLILEDPQQYGSSGFKPSIQINGRDHGLQRVSKEGGFFPAVRPLLPLAQQ